jgi:hypothetical protein
MLSRTLCDHDPLTAAQRDLSGITWNSLAWRPATKGEPNVAETNAKEPGNHSTEDQREWGRGEYQHDVTVNLLSPDTVLMSGRHRGARNAAVMPIGSGDANNGETRQHQEYGGSEAKGA